MSEMIYKIPIYNVLINFYTLIIPIAHGVYQFSMVFVVFVVFAVSPVYPPPPHSTPAA